MHTAPSQWMHWAVWPQATITLMKSCKDTRRRLRIIAEYRLRVTSNMQGSRESVWFGEIGVHCVYISYDTRHATVYCWLLSRVAVHDHYVQLNGYRRKPPQRVTAVNRLEFEFETQRITAGPQAKSHFATESILLSHCISRLNSKTMQQHRFGFYFVFPRTNLSFINLYA